MLQKKEDLYYEKKSGIYDPCSSNGLWNALKKL